VQQQTCRATEENRCAEKLCILWCELFVVSLFVAAYHEVVVCTTEFSMVVN